MTAITLQEHLNQYQKKSARTLNPACHVKTDANYLLGLLGESGEVCEAVKKHIYHGHGPEKIQEEVGDVFWYLAAIATNLGIRLGDCYQPREPGRHMAPLAVCLAQDAADMSFILMDDHDEKAFHVAVKNIIQTLHGILIAGGFCLKETLNQNVEKLQRRYENGFDKT